MKITKKQLKQIIKEELKSVLSEVKSGEIMLNPGLTTSIEDQVARLEDEKEKEAQKIDMQPRMFNLQDIYRLADQLSTTDTKELARYGNPDRIDLTRLFDEYLKTAKAILMGHPKSYGYRTIPIERLFQDMNTFSRREYM